MSNDVVGWGLLAAMAASLNMVAAGVHGIYPQTTTVEFNVAVAAVGIVLFFVEVGIENV